MKGTVYLYEVSHPDYPTVTVPSIGLLHGTPRRPRRPAQVYPVRPGVWHGRTGGGQVSGLSALGGAAQAADGQYPRF